MKSVQEYGPGIDYFKATITELRGLPRRGWADEVRGIQSLIILPNRRSDGLHDSGYRTMDFAACAGGKAYVLLSGCSDVLHLGGIGGNNNPNWGRDGKTYKQQWSIDCLPVSGLLQVFADTELSIGPALSSFSVYSLQKSQRRASNE